LKQVRTQSNSRSRRKKNRLSVEAVFWYNYRTMKSIETLILFFKFFGWLGIVSGFLFLVVVIFIPDTFLFPGITSIQAFLSGLVYLLLARSLSKKENWAWYAALVVFVLLIFSNMIQYFWLKGSFIILIPVFLYVFFLYLLFKGKQVFIKKPKEKSLQWLHSPCFIIIVIGTIAHHLITFFIFSYVFEHIR